MAGRMIYLGVDPGKSGAFAIVDDTEAAHYLPFSKATERDCWEWIKWFSQAPFRTMATIEAVSAMPKQGVSSTFKFGQSYGFLRGLLIAAEIRFEEVRPAVWQGVMGCRSKGDKNVTKAKAQQLFPQVKVTHAIADALLLAEYTRRMEAQRGQVSKQVSS